MIYANIDIHGCAELEEPGSGALETLRVPKYVEEHLCDNGKNQNKNNTGIEFRFVLKGDEATLKFRFSEGETGEITVFYGDFVADWPETNKPLYEGDCEVKIIQSANIEHLRAIAKEHGHRFSPDVVRLFFRGVRPKLVGVEGEIEIPKPEMYPSLKYLSYGSSITHGSIALHSNYHYVEQVARNLGADVTNYGYAGSAAMEPEMADYIADKCEFDFATLEMGINILGADPEDYRKRVTYFVSRIAKAHPNSKIFAIDVYYCKEDIIGGIRAERFRAVLKEVVEQLSLPNVVYVNGKTVLTSSSGMSSGLVHPGPAGIAEMASNLTRIISENIR